MTGGSRLYELDRVEGLPASLKETIVLREAYPLASVSCRLSRLAAHVCQQGLHFPAGLGVAGQRSCATA